MGSGLGSKVWVIPDGFIPKDSSGTLESHEAICLLNCSSKAAKIDFIIYFEDADPLRNIEYTLEANRTKHLRTDSLNVDGVSIPKGVPYAMKITSNIPIIIQYSRMDTTQSANALMTTMAYNAKNKLKE